MNSTSPILVLDSGLGGLTVVRALQERLPCEHILYFGDMARLPYGSKTAETVTKFVKQIIAYCSAMNPKHVVIACNTATALSLAEVRKAFPGLNITGVVDPGARAAAEAAGSKREPIIGIIATEATVRSRAYEKAIFRRRHRAFMMSQATPLLVPMIEDGRDGDDPLVQLALRQYLEPMMQRKMDVMVLGCTHYPILKEAIQRVLGAHVQVIDSAEMCAEDVLDRLTSRGTVNTSNETASLRCFVTDDPPRFARLASRFLGRAIDEPTLVSPDDLYAQIEPKSVRRAV